MEKGRWQKGSEQVEQNLDARDFEAELRGMHRFQSA